MIAAIQKMMRNTLFRLSLLGALLTIFSVGASLGYMYYSMINTELDRVDGVNIAEISELQNVYDQAGQTAIQAAIATGRLDPRITADSPLYKNVYNVVGFEAVGNAVDERGTSFEGLYFLANRSAQPRGNLSNRTGDEKFETLAQAEDGERIFSLIQFRYNNPQFQSDEFNDRRARGIVSYIMLDEERVASVIVGKDVESISRTGERIRTTLLPAMGIAAFLGLLSSFFVSRRFARRVEGFNRLATDVRAGNLDRRAPRNYSEDEMDLLAEHLNAMLDHISRLMEAMRYAGDSVAHDLRTPLTRLRTRLETAAVELGEAEEADVLYAAADDADQLLTTFDSVLRIARLEAGERRELLKPLDPKPILDDLAELYEPACEDAGLSFKADISSKAMISADRGLLSQAVSNLLENAIKYTPSGGSITLICRRTRGHIEIAIADDGPGIPSWDRERVKERFVRLDKSRSLPGSGLGLSLVEAVADLHRAEFIMADNEDLPDADNGGDANRPGLRASLMFPRLKSRQVETKTDAVSA
jgi:signal transduction histidine kinase